MASGFVLDLGANLAGAFVGVLLALLADRYLMRMAARHETQRDRSVLERLRRELLSSVVRNMGAARRLQTPREGIIEHGLEWAVWRTSGEDFIRLCHDLDEEVGLAKFFGEVEQLASWVDRLNDLTIHSPDRPGLRDVRDLVSRSATDLKLLGTVLVTDYGTDAQRRMIGARVATPGEPGV